MFGAYSLQGKSKIEYFHSPSPFFEKIRISDSNSRHLKPATTRALNEKVDSAEGC